MIHLHTIDTEEKSKYRKIEKMTVFQILSGINKEDLSVPKTIKKHTRSIEMVVREVIKTIQNGGRLFYIGAGTSGRLGIVDASECPPTFGVPQGLIIGIIAGGDTAIRKAVENAEDNERQGFQDLKKYKISKKDFVIGIAASGRTPYVVGALRECKKHGIKTGCLVCSRKSKVAQHADFKIEIPVGPEFVTGSTRMKSGTCQKLVLNMITTATFCTLGAVEGGEMVELMLTNKKLVERAICNLMEKGQVNRKRAILLLDEHKTVRKALKFLRDKK